jgi:hypothetical protein
MEMDSEPSQSETAQYPRSLGIVATWAAAITVGCVLIGQGAAQYASLGAPTIASNEPAKLARPNFNSIDFATTGSIKGQTVVISPCTGKEAVP